MRSLRIKAALATVAAVWAVASVALMTYGRLLSWPDYVHMNFGVPFTFATHTLNTIVGEVDLWVLDLGALAADLVFWSAGMLSILLVVFWLDARARVPAQGVN